MRTNLSDITNALEMNPFASRRLRRKFKAESWISTTSKSTEEELVTRALARIELDPKQYRKFIAMLSDIEGMDLIVEKLGTINSTFLHE